MNDQTTLTPLPEPCPTRLTHVSVGCAGVDMMLLNLTTATVRAVVDCDIDLDVTEIVRTQGGAWFRVVTPFDASPPWAEPLSETDAIRAFVLEGLPLPAELVEAVRRLDLEVA